MVKFGGVNSLFDELIRNDDTHAQFLRAEWKLMCPLCQRYQSAHTILSQIPVFNLISVAEIKQSEGDPFAALMAKINTAQTTNTAQTCLHCGATEHMNKVPRTSFESCGVPEFIRLDLPERDPPSRYNLGPDEDHVLCIQGVPVTTYRLMGVILYKLDAHYITDVYKQRERCWVRFDGYEPANGIGQCVRLPARGYGHVHHRFGLEGRYYPVLLVYGRKQVAS